MKEHTIDGTKTMLLAELDGAEVIHIANRDGSRVLLVEFVAYCDTVPRCLDENAQHCIHPGDIAEFQYGGVPLKVYGQCAVIGDVAPMNVGTLTHKMPTH